MFEFCFVCNRVTGHFGEHDGLIHAGLAENEKVNGECTGTVLRTAAWDDALAARISEVEYEHYVRDGYDGMDLDAIVAEAKGQLQLV
jgi:hypothetical protein